LHHLAELSRAGELAFARKHGDLGDQEVATHLGPGETRAKAHGMLVAAESDPVFARTEILLNALLVDDFFTAEGDAGPWRRLAFLGGRLAFGGGLGLEGLERLGIVLGQ